MGKKERKTERSQRQKAKIIWSIIEASTDDWSTREAISQKINSLGVCEIKQPRDQSSLSHHQQPAGQLAVTQRLNVEKTTHDVP